MPKNGPPKGKMSYPSLKRSKGSAKKITKKKKK